MVFTKITEVSDLEESVRNDSAAVNSIKQCNLLKIETVLENDLYKVDDNIASGVCYTFGTVLSGLVDGIVISLYKSDIGYMLDKFVDKIDKLFVPDISLPHIYTWRYNNGREGLIIAAALTGLAIFTGIKAYKHFRKSAKLEDDYNDDLNKAVEHYVSGNLPKNDTIQTFELKGKMMKDDKMSPELSEFIGNINEKGAGAYVHKDTKDQYVITISRPDSFEKKDPNTFFADVKEKYSQIFKD